MTITILQGDCLRLLPTLPAASVQCVVTSPPYYGLRDYGVEGQIGLETTPAEFVAVMVRVFHEVWRVLRDDGVLWLNLGDSYNGGGGYSSTAPSNVARGDKFNSHARQFESAKRKGWNGLKPKDLIGIPWRVAFALQDDGWYLRADCIWSKPNCMPESVTDRPTRSHEYLFLFAKSERYFYDADAIAENVSNKTDWTYPQPDKAARAGITSNGTGASSLRVKPTDGKRNRRTVWTIPTQSFDGAHFATFPEKLIEPCILAGSRPGDVVLDPFAGSGTTGRVALRLQRRAVLIDLNADYIELQEQRTNGVQTVATELWQ